MEGPGAALLVAQDIVGAWTPVGGGLGHLALQPVHRPLPLRWLQYQVVPHLEMESFQIQEIFKTHRRTFARGGDKALDCLVSSTRI